MSWNVFQFNIVTFHNIWWYLVIFHDIWWYLVTFHDKTCCLSWYIMTCHDKSWNDSIWFREMDKQIKVVHNNCPMGIFLIQITILKGTFTEVQIPIGIFTFDLESQRTASLALIIKKYYANIGANRIKGEATTAAFMKYKCYGLTAMGYYLNCTRYL